MKNVFALVAVLVLSQTAFAVTLPIDQPIPGAVAGIYTDKMSSLAKNWPPAEVPDLEKTQGVFWMRGIKSSEHSTYVGVIKTLKIDAPFEKVAALLEDFEGYKFRDHDLKIVKIDNKEDNHFNVFWERKAPVFFVANTKYEQTYIVEKSAKRLMMRYQLAKADSLDFSDGVVVIEPVNPPPTNPTKRPYTLLTALDFYQAHWGILGSVSPGKVWDASMEGYAKGDIALKMQAEHPDWESDKVLDRAKEWLDLHPVLPVQYVDIQWNKK